MGYLIMALQLILSLSILVTLHELGHFWPAKKFGMRVEKFYLFFDAWFSLYKVKKGETEYGIGWLPLGGYVKISGMVDESMDKEQLAQEPQPWEFRSKPAWQRLIVMLGGVTVNFILGFFLLSIGLFVWGKLYLPLENATYGLMPSQLGEEMGLKAGDQILQVGDQKLERFNPGIVINEMLFNEKNTLVVRRDGKEINLTVADSSILKLPKQNRQPLFMARMPFVIGEIKEGRPAAKSKQFEEMDSLVSINGKEVRFFDQFVSEIGNYKNQKVTIGLYRDGVKKEVQVKADSTGKLGIAPFGPDLFFDYKRQKYGFFEAIPAGFNEGTSFLGTQITAFGQMFTGRIDARDGLGGFISIAKLFPTEWDWEHFWRMTAILSLILGFMNLLPIPALDGGHVVFLLYEMIARKPVSQKTLEIAQLVGFVLLISLLLFANGNDIYKLFQ
jgi:regulator of sigma E protease